MDHHENDIPVCLLRENETDTKTKNGLIDALLKNRISLEGLVALRDKISAGDLSDIIQRIYDLNEAEIFRISTLEGVLEKLNTWKNERRNALFFRKIRKEFKTKDNKKRKVILAEGDSWFNYPIILTDLIDRISMEDDFAVYSIASGGDWLLNMLKARKYVEELSIMHPDVFLISGGGNDIVGSYRLAAVVQPEETAEFDECKWAKALIDKVRARRHAGKVPLDDEKFAEGIKHLSKDFFSLLMFFHLQYYFLIRHILMGEGDKPGKYDGMKIITQGYDFPIPSFKKKFALNPFKWYVPFIRSFLGHGHWLKTPLLMRCITNDQKQENIMYAMIYLFNEMMIEIGYIFSAKLGKNAVFHIDSRGSVGKDGWADELHPKPKQFMKAGAVFVDCINDGQPTYDHVFVVKNKTL